MGFSLDNEQHRQRISISPKTMQVLEQDVKDFNLAGLGELINAILAYLEKHNLTRENELSQYQNETSIYLEKAGIDPRKNGILDKLVASRKREIIEAIAQNKTHKRGNIGKNIYIKQNVRRWLESPENTEDEYYDGSLLLYLNCVLEDYVKKDLFSRESVAMDEKISRINRYIEDGEWVNIYYADDSCIKLYPVKIMSDKLNTHAYLACYKASNNKLIPVSYRISSLPEDMQISRVGNLNVSKADIDRLSQLIKERRVDFLAYETTNIKVRMTPLGMKSYTRMSRLRPDIIQSESQEGGVQVCTFHCTLQQARYYFATLGKDVEILEPASLRSEFKKMFRQALDLYN